MARRGPWHRLHRLRHARPANLRAMAWAAASLARARRQLDAGDVREVALAPPPAGLPERASETVLAVLRRRHATCLERSLVLRAWLASRGAVGDVVIGVRHSDGRFEAHAWLDGEPQRDFAELVRLPGPTQPDG